MPNKSAVHIVHTLGFGFGCIGVGLPDWGLFWGRGIFQGGARFESHLGHNVSGPFFLFGCCQNSRKRCRSARLNFIRSL